MWTIDKYSFQLQQTVRIYDWQPILYRLTSIAYKLDIFARIDSEIPVLNS
jgi:hypothetical protein